MKNDLLLQTMSCKKLRYKIAFTYITKKQNLNICLHLSYFIKNILSKMNATWHKQAMTKS